MAAGRSPTRCSPAAPPSTAAPSSPCRRSVTTSAAIPSAAWSTARATASSASTSVPTSRRAFPAFRPATTTATASSTLATIQFGATRWACVVEPFHGADGDGDGIVDCDDYDIWKSHFGQKLVFSTGGGGAALARRRRARRRIAVGSRAVIGRAARAAFRRATASRTMRRSAQSHPMTTTRSLPGSHAKRAAQTASDEVFAEDQKADERRRDGIGLRSANPLDAAFAIFGT